MGDKDVDNEGQQTTRKYEYEGDKMRMMTARMRKTRMRTRGEDNKEDKDEGQQG